MPSAVIRPRWQQAGARGCPHCHSLSRDPSIPHVIHLYIHRPSLLHVGPCEYHFGLVWRCLCAATSASSPGPLPGRLKPVAAGCRGTRRCYTETRPSSRSRVSRLPPIVSSFPRIGLKLKGKRSQGVLAVDYGVRAWILSGKLVGNPAWGQLSTLCWRLGKLSLQSWERGKGCAHCAWGRKGERDR